MTFFFGSSDMPEELKEQMRRDQDRKIMEIQDYRHSIHSFLTELPLEQMLLLRRLLSDIGGDESGKLANYFEGITVGILETKFQVCPSCGVNHETEFLESLNEENDTPEQNEQTLPEPMLVGPESDLDFELAEMPNESDTAEVSPEHEVKSLKQLQVEAAERRQSKLDEYNLIKGLGSQVICKGCQMVYPSLKDRMKKDPDQCPGCEQKSKWG